MAVHQWLWADNSSFLIAVGGRPAGIIVWVGVALLAGALLVLARTRWGQSQPLSKCVALSVFAHLLLFLYAHGTRLLSDAPLLPGDDVIQLAFIGADAAMVEDVTDAAAQAEPWDELPVGDPLTEAADVVRMDTDTPQVRRTVPDAATTDTSQDLLPPELVVTSDTPRPVVARPAPLSMRPTESPVEPSAVEPPPVQPVVRATSAPQTAGPERIDASPALHRSADFHSEATLPTELMTIGSRMQQLADVDARAEVADALAANRDQLAEAENRGMSPFESTGVAADQLQHAGNGALVTLPPLRRDAGLPAMADAAFVAQTIARATPRLGDGQPVPEMLRLRALPPQRQVAPSLGGSVEATAAVDAALAWLASAQEDDGRWDPVRWGGGIELKVAGHDREGAGADADTGITGLAVLAFLGNGQTHLEGTYRRHVQRGLEYLLRTQDSDGSLAGPARLYAKMYCHGMASLALSEALAMTGDVRIQPYVERATEFTVRAQHPVSGGWRYQPGDHGDMSQFGWQVMALKSAALAGIRTPQTTREGMLHFLQRCEHGTHGGLAGYRPGTPPSRSMTAEALVCRYFLDLAPDQALVTEASEYLLGEVPQPGIPNLYYWYYGTLALFQVQGDAWTSWNAALQKQLLQLQNSDGPLAGSWDPDTVWGCYGGRVYSTAMATLCLEVYYRYLPLTAYRADGEIR
ncbi:MAG: hypothetical protein MUF48_13225 [Pirellulaceae bacterium]|jgi:hypothetical protein|nr:hypothetical protein [Pirellulaceae bacterium]